MPPFEVGNALKNGVVDLANTTRRSTPIRCLRLTPEAYAALYGGTEEKRRL